MCRQLGFNPSGATAVSNAYFGKGADPIWLVNFFCSGLERKIDSCRHNIWGSNDCDHSEDVGVICRCKSLQYYE